MEQEKIYSSTEKKRERFRRKGQTVYSRELETVLVLFAAALCVFVLPKFFLTQINELFDFYLSGQVFEMAEQKKYYSAMTFAGKKIFLMLSPVFLLALFLSLSSYAFQTGLKVPLRALDFNLGKINPLNGIKKVFSFHSFFEGTKGLIKTGLILFVCAIILQSEIFNISSLLRTGSEEVLSYIGFVLIKLLSALGLCLLAIAGVDYLYQKQRLEKKMRMSQEEIKEENKDEGVDSMIKNKIQRIHKQS